MKRSAKRPNYISQEIKNLKPGRLYSLKMFTADYRDLIEGKSIKQIHAVSIKIENVEIIREKSFQHVFSNPFHFFGPFNDKHRAWLNYHWRVFRAKGRRAKLTISDRVNTNESGEPVGQELVFNFIEVQPYFEEKI